MTRHFLLTLSLLILVPGCNSGGSGSSPAPPLPTPTVKLEPGDMRVTEMTQKELAQLEDPLQAQLAVDGKLTRRV